MMASKELTRTMMATAAVSLFVPESLAPNVVPRFREGLGEIQALFERILEQTFGVSEGIWIGTPVNLTRERESRELELRMAAKRRIGYQSTGYKILGARDLFSGQVVTSRALATR